METKQPYKELIKKTFPVNFLIKKGFISLFVLCLFYSGIRAQITTGFELDGNATSTGSNPPDDWDLIYSGTSHAQVTTGVMTDAAVDNIFQGGTTKDPNNLNQWGWTTGTATDKDDILHGGVALYNNCKLYFFADRYATNGSANIGFWLFKSNVSVNPNGTFSGLHTVGDVFMFSQFVNGGGTSIIKAYKWVGSGGNTNGTLDSVPVNGVNSFAITNADSVPSPWPYTPKSGALNYFGKGAFFEGGIDLCSVQGLDPCFTSFLIETRASFVVNSVLKDFLGGSFTSMPQVTLAGGTRCINGPAVTLKPVVTGGIKPYTFLWSPGGSTNDSITVSPSGNTTYTVTVAGVNGCAKSATAIVTINPLPNVNAGSDKVISCNNPTATLSGSSSTSGATFSWTTIGGNIVSGGSTKTPIVNAAGTYIFAVTSSSGCIARDTAIVTSTKTPPNVNAGPDKTLTCTVTQVTLDGSSSTSGATFSWTAINGGAIFSGGTTATPIVQIPGTYILTVTNPANGCTAKDTANVSRNINVPNANAGADKVLTCSVTSIALSGSTTTTNTKYLWTTSGGHIVSGQTTLNPSVNAVGTYSLTVTDTVNGCQSMDVAVVTLNHTPPNVNAGVDKVLTCTTTFIALSGSSTTSGATFSWVASGGGYIVSEALTATPTVDSAGVYTLTVTDPTNGCTATDTAKVTLDKNAPNVNAGADKILTCTTTSISLNGSSSTAGATFSWIASGGGHIVSGGTSATPTVDAAGVYTLTVTNPTNGCTATDIALVTLNNTPPNANAGLDKTLTCTVTQVILDGSSTTPKVSFSWTAINGGAILSGGNTKNPHVQIPGTYVLTVTDSVNGCIASDTAKVFQDTNSPNVDAGSDKILTCTVTSIALSGLSSTANTTYNWTTNDGNIVSGQTTLTPIVNAGGSYLLTVTNTTNECQASDIAVVTVNRTAPNVSAGIDKVLTCTTTAIVLNGSSSTPKVSFSWVASGGGHILSDALTATPTVDAAGIYTLTITDSVNGCTAIDAATVTLNNTPPNANAGTDKILNCAVTSISLSGSSSTSGVKFSWVASSGGHIVSGALTTTPTVDAAGVYTLTVRDTINGCTATDVALVTLNNTPPNANAGSDKVLTCTTTSIALSGSSSTTGVKFSWVASSGGDILSGALTATPTAEAAGVYTLTVTDTTNKCTATDIALVTLNNTEPNADAGIDKVLTCTTTSIALSGSSTTPGATFSWVASGGGHIVSGALTAIPTVDSAGMYTLTVTDPANGCTMTDVAMVTLNNTKPNANAGIDKVLTCTTTSIELSGSSTTQGVTFSWVASSGGHIVSGPSTAIPIVNAAGVYALIVTDPTNGCTATDTTKVTLDNAIPDVNAGADKVLTCTTTSIALSGSSSTNGVTFSWVASGGGHIVSGDLTETPTVNAAGIYTLTVTNPRNGCTATDVAQVTLNNTAPNAEAGPNKTLTCTLTQVTLNGSSTTPRVSFSWVAKNGGAILSGGNTATPLVQIPGTFILTVTDSVNGCTAQDSAKVFQDINSPNVSAGTDKILTCSVTSIGLSGSSTIGSTTYNWTTSDGHIVSGQTTLTPVVNAAGSYLLTVTNTINGCQASDIAVVTLNDSLPNANAGIDKVLTCTTTSIALSGSSSTPGATFSWLASGGGHIVSGASTATPTVDIAGVYTLTVTNPRNGCMASDTAKVTLDNTIPDVNAGADKVLNCTTTSIALSGSSSTNGATFSWVASGGGHIVSGDLTETPTVDAAGIYTLTVTSPRNGCTATDIAQVTLNNTAPNAEAGPDKTLTCGVTQVTLDGSSTTPGVTFSWIAKNGGVILSGGNTATPIVQIPGMYVLTVVDPINGCTAQDSAKVFQDINAPNVSAGPDKILTCSITSIALSGSTSTEGTTYNWTTNDGNFVSGQTTLTPIVDAVGTYSLTVTTTSNGCQAMDIAVVILNDSLPNANAGADKILTCTTTSTALNGSSSTPGATFSWLASGGGHIVSGASTATPTVDAAGVYTLTVTNPRNGCTAFDTAKVTLDNIVPDINAGADKVLTCTTTSIALSGSSSTPGATFSWVASGGGHIVSGATTATPTVDAAGIYTLTVTNPRNGCTAIDAASVTLDNNKPDVSAGPDKVLTCTTISIALSGSSTTPGATFSWVASNGGNIVQGAIHPTPLVNAAGTYILTVTNPVNGCTAKDTVLITLDNVAPNANAGADKILTCTTTSIALSGSSSTPGATFSWVASGGGHIVSDATTATPTVDAAGDYTLTVTNPTNGCTATDVATVTLNNTAPNAEAGPDKTLTCTLTQVTLDGSSTTPGAIFSWAAKNGGAILSGGNTATPLVQIPGTFVLTVTNPVNGCTAQDSAKVFQDINSPNVGAGADKILTCTVTSIALSGSSTTASTTYNWTTNDGHIVSGQTTLTPTVDAAGNYMLTVTNTINGCQASDVAVVTLNNTVPNVNAGIDKVLNCITTSISLSGSSSTPGATFSWIASGGGHIISGSLTTTPTVDAAGIYTLTVTNPTNGCTATDAATVTLDNTVPNANAGVDKVLNCLTTSIALSGSSSTIGVTFSWVASGGGHIVSGALTATPTVDAAGVYTLTVTNPVNGCTATDAATVTLDNAAPNANAGIDKVLTCTTTSIALSGSSTTSGATFSWVASAGGHIVSDALTATPTVDAAGVYTLTVTNPANGCTAIDVALVTLDNTVPNVNAGIDKVLTCTITSIALSGSSSTPGATFSWVASGVGHIVSDALTATPTVDAAGVYTLTVTNPRNGCTSTDAATVTLDNAAPNANAGIDKVLTCTITSIALSGSSTTQGATFSWVASGGGHIVSGALTATPTADAVGLYMLTVTNPTNGCTATDVAMVILDNVAPNANAGIDKVLTCTTTSIALSGSSSTAGATFSWAVSAGGHIVSGVTTATPIADAAGIYMLTVTNPTNGCTAIDAAMVTIDNVLPNANAGIDKVLTCTITSIALSGSSSTQGAIFSWVASGGGHIVSGVTTATPIVDAAGVYTLTVTNPTNGCTATDVAMITLDNALPNADAGADQVLTCAITSIALNGSSSTQGAMFSWAASGGGHIVSGALTATPIVDAVGIYTLTVTSPTNGCTATDIAMVTLHNTPPIVHLGNDTTFMNCHALTLILNAGNPGSTYVWSTSEITQTITVSTSGMYYVKVTNAIGCSASDTINVTIINNNIDVNLGNDTTVCKCIVLDPGYPNASIVWCSGQTYSTLNACVTGMYCVTVSNGTCTDSDTINVIVNPPPVVNLGNDTTLVSGSLTLNAGNPGAHYLWSTGDTTQTITVTESGQYYVLVAETLGYGCIASDTINVNIVNGVNENAASDLRVKVSPNPSINKTFSLSFNVIEKNNVEIRIMNVLGKVVYSEKLRNFSGTYRKMITLNDMADGIYFTEILNGTQRSTVKIILE